MKYTRLIAVILALCLLLGGCGSNGGEETTENTVLATTYPMYYLCQRLLDGTQGITAEAMITGEVSCLHDYTLTTTQMRMIEGAELVVLSGAGLEDFMDAALSGLPEGKIVDSSVGVSLIDEDPHIWLDPERYAIQSDNIAAALAETFPEASGVIEANAKTLRQELLEFKTAKNAELHQTLTDTNIITFHDGFSYFADAFGLTILAAIEEEEGAEPSAAELKEICDLVGEYDLKAIFTEVNGSDNAAKIICEETGVNIHTLTTIMSAQSGDYFTDMQQNLDALLIEDMKEKMG